MLTVALKDGILTNEEKVALRMQRQELGIDSQEHLLLLNKLGWTLDDYEVRKSLYECWCIGPNWAQLVYLY